MLKTNTVIVGAGIVGLAVAREISTSGHEVVVLVALYLAEEMLQRDSYEQ